MNVLLIGSGGREHALAWKIKQSETLDNLFIIPGNPGTEALGQNVRINPGNHDEIIKFCKEKNIEFVIVGPEQPLVEGIADSLRKENIVVFGPSKKASAIEGEKSFAKNLMRKYSIPTAAFEVFTKDEKAKALEYLSGHAYPVVIKADGLAAGKGVAICENFDSAAHIIEDYFQEGIFGEAGYKIVVEEFLTGQEASLFVVTDGAKYSMLPAAQDHKRIGDNDTGKNTGGMGAYAPAPIITSELLSLIEKTIVVPTLEAMNKEGAKYNGCLYCGLIITSQGPKVIEFNCRFGDPETQVVLPLLEGDFLKLLYSAGLGNLDESLVKYNGGASVVVVAASKGYPDSYEKGFVIDGLETTADDIIVYHAGTTKKDGNIVTNGGRVLGVTSVVKPCELSIAKQRAYDALSKIHFTDMYFRKDISDKGINFKKD